MTYRWVRVRGTGDSLTFHAVTDWPASLETACGWQGGPVKDIEIGADAERYCLACRRRMLR